MSLKKVYTLVFVRTEGEVLLGLKKRGFGIGKWNGFGGKVEPNETVVDAAVREMKEECCLDIKNCDLKNVGHLEFTFEGDPLIMDVRVFATSTYHGVPNETEEMVPRWFPFEHIPYKEMWPDDKYWFPYMLKDKPFYARFNYKGFEEILNYTIKEFESIESIDYIIK